MWIAFTIIIGIAVCTIAKRIAGKRKNINHSDFTPRPSVKVNLTNEFMDFIDGENKIEPPTVVLTPVNKPTEEEIQEMIEKRNNILKNMGISIENKDVKKVSNGNDIFQYYRFANGIIFKVKPDEFLLYRLDPNTNTWIRDDEMYTDFAYVSYNYSPITIEDNYDYAEDISREN